MKKVYTVETLVEDIDMNSCSVEVFENEKDAIAYADKEIDDYGAEYKGEVVERNPHYYCMQAGDAYVTIEIVEHEVR